MIKTTVLFCVLIVSKAARYGEKNDIALFLFIFLKEKQMFQDGVQEAIESNWDTGNRRRGKGDYNHQNCTF